MEETNSFDEIWHLLKQLPPSDLPAVREFIESRLEDAEDLREFDRRVARGFTVATPEKVAAFFAKIEAAAAEDDSDESLFDLGEEIDSG